MSGLLDIFDFESVLAPSEGILGQQICNFFISSEDENDDFNNQVLSPSQSNSNSLSKSQNYSHESQSNHLNKRPQKHAQALPPEIEEGNVEYKLKLINPTPNRLQQLVTQMKWRLKEGGGKAIYELGVCDNGELQGLTQSEIEASLATFNVMAKRSGAKIDIIREKVIFAPTCQNNNNNNNSNNKRTKDCNDSCDSCGDEVDEPDDSESKIQKVLEVVVVKKTKEEKPTSEIRVIMLGNVGSGKSSLLGVLTQGDMDDGRGRARINLFRHQHELQSGRTSSISKEILGITSSGLPINYSAGGSQEICDKSRKLIVFIDSGGHPKYLKTTVFTMTAMHADYAVLVIDPQDDIDCETNRLHFNLALALELPILVVINKIDLQTESEVQDIILRTRHFISASSKVFKSTKNSQVIQNDDDLEKYANISETEIKESVPIFLTSCVIGSGIDIFQKYLHYLKPTMSVSDKKKLMKRRTVFQIDETFRIPSVGLVVSGFLASGRLKAQDVLKAGPLKDGSFVEVEVAGLQRHKVSRKFVVPGETSTLALKSKPLFEGNNIESLIRKGMCLLSRKGNYQKNVCDHFSADIFLMPNSEPLTIKSQVMVFCENVRQLATVIFVHEQNDNDSFVNGIVQPNETATVILQFNRQPQFLESGYRLLLQKGTTNAVGRVTCLNPICPSIYRN